MEARLPEREGPGGRGARGRIIQAAIVLFGRQGINATGVAELAAAARVSKRTLYQHFAQKDDVVLAYLEELNQRPELTAEGALERDDLTARARLLELFTAVAEQPHRGCPVLAVAVERPDPKHQAHRFVADHKQRFAERLADVAREAGARSADTVGLRLALLYDGAAMRCAALGGPEPAHEAFAVAAALLDEAIG